MKISRSESFFSRLLLQWDQHENFRTMPWKFEKDPYKIWLSEIILQQTRVEQGLAYYERFINEFPDVQKLAIAPETMVMKMWEGLGYYSRCRNLLATARHVTDKLHGQFPDTYHGLVQLKGVGPYTAAAIASFAFGLPHAVVDGNVIRVLSRVFGIDNPWDTTEGKKIFEALANKLIDKKEPGRYNQAIMDFGATICKPRNPDCENCPFSKKCTALLQERIEDLPLRSKKIKVKERWFYYVICNYQNGIYIRKRTSKDIWQHLHEFVLIEQNISFAPEKILQQQALKKMLSMPYEKKHISAWQTQKLTHQTIHSCFVELEICKPLESQAYFWADKNSLQQFAFPRTIIKYLQQRDTGFMAL